MPLTWNQISVAFSNAKYTFAEISIALELFLLKGGYSGYKRRQQVYGDFFKSNPEKKKQVVKLVMKVKGQTIKQDAKVSKKTKVTVSDIDLIISEILNIKPKVEVHVD
tara:strand:- start:675 stop:998 length:324 start_codon:yes stop_codon:yes gene_type:complete